MPRPRTFRRLYAIIIKEFKHVWFDPGFLFLTILSPAVLLTLLAYIFSFDVDNTRLAIIDRDQTPQAASYIRDLTADGSLRITQVADNYDDITEIFRAGEADAALIIPPGFGQAIDGSEPASVNLAVDGSDVGTALQIIAAVQQRTTTYVSRHNADGPPPFDVRLRVWFNPNLDSQHSMIPGLMSLVLILPSMAVALAITREKESGTFEMLVTTPVRGYEYLLGKLFVYLVMGLIGTLFALAVAVFWFRVPFRGQLPLYLLMTADYMFALMGFCMIVAHFVPNQRAATTVILLTLFVPSFFMTGLLLPVDSHSPASLAIAFSLPSTHYIIVSRGIALKALTLHSLMLEAQVMLAAGAGATIASIFLFDKKVRA